MKTDTFTFHTMYSLLYFINCWCSDCNESTFKCTSLDITFVRSQSTWETSNDIWICALAMYVNIFFTIHKKKINKKKIMVMHLTASLYHGATTTLLFGKSLCSLPSPQPNLLIPCLLRLNWLSIKFAWQTCLMILQMV